MLSFYSRLFPELLAFKCDDDRKKALRAAAQRPYTLGSVLAVAAVVGLTLAKWRSWAQTSARASLFILLVPLTGFAGFLLVWITRSRIRRSLRRQLNERGYPVCMACGYDLRGNPEGGCPECWWGREETAAGAGC